MSLVAQSGRTRLAVTLREITITLAEMGLLEPLGFSRTLTIPPGGTVVSQENVQPGKVIVVSAIKIESYPDHANAFFFYFDRDDIPRFYDQDVVQRRYDDYLMFFDLGMLLKASKFLRVVVTNTSTVPSTFSFTTLYGVVDSLTWDVLVAKYFRTVRDEIFARL